MAKKTNKDPAPEQVQQPAPEAATTPEAPEPEGLPPLLLFHHLSLHPVTAPTYSHSPRRW